MLASTDLDICDADERRRTPAASGIAAVTAATLPSSRVSREAAPLGAEDRSWRRCTPKPARIEEATLDEGVPMVWRDFGHKIRAAYDPAQISADRARSFLALHFNFVEEDGPGLTPRAARVLGQLEAAKEGRPPTYRAFLDVVAREIRLAGDSVAVLDEVLTVIKDVSSDGNTEQDPAPCQIHAWCFETGDHGEHSGHTIWASCPDAYGNSVLPAGLIDWGKGVKVGLLDLNLTPAEARIRIAELRAHLDNIEALVVTAETPAAGL
ncbi:hypothetical protein [Streptomyces virginiae]|uniref:hypothetical protein n=1 Tax=Streptomyces virginiae TaxID=1961 RepID=UPI0032528734